MINRKKFFDGVRPIFGGLKQGQVVGCERLIGEFERRGWVDLRWLAYILATVKWETNHTMLPIKELGSQAYLRGKRYWPWIGRGYVQLTWKANYVKFRDEVKRLFNVDIVARPDDAMVPEAAAYIAFEGMKNGTFTGKSLQDYFNKNTDWVNARRIINGTDKAVEIANLAMKFHKVLVASEEKS